MKSNLLIIILVVIIIGGGAFLLMNDDADDAIMDDDNGEVVTNAVPAPGSEGVDETVVSEDDDAMMESSDTEVMEDADDAMMESETVVVDLTGKNFEFSKSEIRVKKGDTVTVNFESTGGFHDWVVDEFDAATDQVSAGGKTSVTFVADKTGTYEYYCSVGNHRAQGMVGTLIVE